MCADIWDRLDGFLRPGEVTKRITKVIQFMKKLAQEKDRKISGHHLLIESDNNFPTAAGMASSASGMAALAFGLAQLYGIEEKYTSIAARLGSGSACRSVFGGIVEWNVDPNPAHWSESSSQQLLPESHWPDLRVLICVVSDSQKDTGSTPGMQTTVRTSELMKMRSSKVVGERLPRLRAALTARNLKDTLTLSMQESNQLHAVCLDSWPPISYLNDTSRAIIKFVHAFNDHFKETLLGYTFDAGANAFLLVEENRAALVLSLLARQFAAPSHRDQPKDWVRGIQYPAADMNELPEPFLNSLPSVPSGVCMIISTKVGPGPQVIEKINI